MPMRITVIMMRRVSAAIIFYDYSSFSSYMLLLYSFFSILYSFTFFNYFLLRPFLLSSPCFTSFASSFSDSACFSSCSCSCSSSCSPSSCSCSCSCCSCSCSSCFSCCCCCCCCCSSSSSSSVSSSLSSSSFSSTCPGYLIFLLTFLLIHRSLFLF